MAPSLAAVGVVGAHAAILFISLCLSRLRIVQWVAILQLLLVSAVGRSRSRSHGGRKWVMCGSVPARLILNRRKARLEVIGVIVLWVVDRNVGNGMAMLSGSLSSPASAPEGAWIIRMHVSCCTLILSPNIPI